MQSLLGNRESDGYQYTLTAFGMEVFLAHS